MEKQMVAGKNLIQVQEFIQYKWGTDGLELFEKESQFRFDGVLEEKLYPFKDYIDMLDNAQKIFSDDTIAYNIGWHRARNLLLAKGTKQYGLEILDKVASAWTRFNNFGELTVKKHDDGKFSVFMTNFQSHPLYCERMRGFFTGLVSSLKNQSCAVKEVNCINDGSDACEFLIEVKNLNLS
jgi:predicted hydrocarbon binding protein